MYARRPFLARTSLHLIHACVYARRPSLARTSLHLNTFRSCNFDFFRLVLREANSVIIAISVMSAMSVMSVLSVINVFSVIS